MNQENKNAFLEKYNKNTHIIGRIFLSIAVLALVAAPFLMGFVLDARPNFPAFLKGFAQIAIIYIPSCIVEFLIYTPMLGAGGGYLAFVTGNLINMKIPCAINAKDIAGTKTGTTENEIVSTISVATSSLVTTIIIALGVALIIPLTPILEAEVLKPAFVNVVPALFGAMATRYFRKGKHLVAIPLLVMSLLFVFVPSLIGSVGMLMLLSGAITIAHSFIRFKKQTGEKK